MTALLLIGLLWVLAFIPSVRAHLRARRDDPMRTFSRLGRVTAPPVRTGPSPEARRRRVVVALAVLHLAGGITLVLHPTRTGLAGEATLVHLTVAYACGVARVSIPTWRRRPARATRRAMAPSTAAY